MLIGKLGLCLKMVLIAMFIVSLRGIFVKRFCTSKDMRYLLHVSTF